MERISPSAKPGVANDGKNDDQRADQYHLRVEVGRVPAPREYGGVAPEFNRGGDVARDT